MAESLKILVAVTDRAVADRYAGWLRAGGGEPCLVTDGNSLDDALQTMATPPDVAILGVDIALPPRWSAESPPPVPWVLRAIDRDACDASADGLPLDAHDLLLQPATEADLRCRLAVAERHVLAMREAERLAQRYRRSLKLESLEIMAAGIAHDFNNVLQIIVGNAQLALQAKQLPAPLVTRMLNVQRAADRGAEMTSLLLAFLGTHHLQTQPIDINAFLTRFQTKLHGLVGPRIQLELKLADGLPLASGAGDAIEQALIKVVTNASEAIGQRDGHLTIATSWRLCDHEFLSAARLDETAEEGAYVMISVMDDGCGMDDSVRERIFDPFFTTKFMGRGLGLTAVFGIMRALRGSIRIQSTPDQGSCVTLLLPCAEELPMADPTNGNHQIEPSRDGAILVVDDERTVRQTASDMLHQLGYAAETYNSANGAIRRLRQTSARMAAIILDAALPSHQAIGILEQAGRLYRQLPVILCGGFDESRLDRSLLDQRNTVYLRKPFRLADLAAVLQRIGLA